MGAELDFATFVSSHAASLYRSAYLLTGSKESAEDLVQDTFLRLYPSWQRVQAAPVPLAYVRRSLMNNFVNSRRRGWVRREIPVEEVPPRPGLGDLAESVSDRDLVARLLAQQPARNRAVLVLRYFHDLPDEEIAAELGIRRGTVRSIVSRSLTAMRASRELDGTGPEMNGTPS